MSDPVSNVEIEDVLSSIRRLVSAEERDDSAGEERAESRRAEASRLVLTPAQRVDDTPDEGTGPENEIAGPEDAAAAAGPEFDAPASSSVEDRLSGIEDAEIAEPPEDESEPEPEFAEEDMPVFLRHRPDGDHRQASDADQAGQGDDPSEMSEAVGDDVTDDPGRPDGAAGPGGGGEVSHETGNDESPEVDLKALQARIAGFETAVAEQEDEWEPDGTSDDDYAGAQVSPLPWKDGAHDSADETDDPASGAEAVEPPQDDENDAGGTWYADDAIIDEDALRDMVSEIVRQELQGALGERITRNVRKLVRREIHRALMSQGID